MFRMVVFCMALLAISSLSQADEYFMCGSDGDSLIGYVPTKSDPVIKIIPVAFADSDIDSLLLSSRHFDLYNDFGEYLQRQSNQTWSVEPIPRPQDINDTDKYMWVLEHDADDYKSYGWCDSAGVYQEFWDEYSSVRFNHYGEMEVEALYAIKNAYEDSSLSNPLVGVDYLCFMPLVGAIVSRDSTEAGDPIMAGGLGSLCFNVESEPYFQVLANVDGRARGTLVPEGRNQFVHFQLEGRMAHELGHQFFGGTHTDGNIREQFEVTERTCFHAVYDNMTSAFPPDQGFIPYSIWNRLDVGWVNDPIPVTANLHNVTLYDMSLPSALSYSIELPPFLHEDCDNTFLIPQHSCPK